MSKYISWVTTTTATFFAAYMGLHQGIEQWQNALIFWLWFIGLVSLLAGLPSGKRIDVSDAMPSWARKTSFVLGLAIALWVAAYGFFVTAVVYLLGKAAYAAKLDETIKSNLVEKAEG